MYVEIDWPAFWTRFAAGAVVGSLLGLYLWLEGTAHWVAVPLCPLAIGSLVGIFGAEPFARLFRFLSRL